MMALATALGAGLLVSTPAHAAPSGCTSGWSAWSGPSWGKMRSCWAINTDNDFSGNYKYWWAFQVQDTQTDGYSVHLEGCGDSAWNQNGSIWMPDSCHNPGTPPPYSPLYGLNLCDINCQVPNPDWCIQSSGAVVGSRAWPSAFTPTAFADPEHSYFEVAIVKGRCEGSGGYQNVDRYGVVQASSGSPGHMS